jgi:hypothetical protein
VAVNIVRISIMYWVETGMPLFIFAKIENFAEFDEISISQKFRENVQTFPFPRKFRENRLAVPSLSDL